MKKRYMTPEVQTVSVRLMTMIANSNAVTALGLGEETPAVTYGGVDEDGELDPEARRTSKWDDDEEDE